MNQFEAAKLKHAKNYERQHRDVEPLPEVIEPEVIKEKIQGPTTAATIEVKVTLPNGEFSFVLVKPFVFQNANQSKLTKAEFIRCVKNGLDPLLGTLK